MRVDEVVARALALGDDLVEITGGEPLLQLEVYPAHEPPGRCRQDGPA